MNTFHDKYMLLHLTKEVNSDTINLLSYSQEVFISLYDLSVRFIDWLSLSP
jgi:hypothetical protein